MSKKCRFLTEDGICTKLARKTARRCRPSDASWFDDEDEVAVEIVNPGQMCELSSVFGNAYVGIEGRHIDALRGGKVIYFEDGEYGVFIGIKKEVKEDDEHETAPAED